MQFVAPERFEQIIREDNIYPCAGNVWLKLGHAANIHRCKAEFLTEIRYRR